MEKKTWGISLLPLIIPKLCSVLSSVQGVALKHIKDGGGYGWLCGIWWCGWCSSHFPSPGKKRCRNQNRDNRDVAVDTNSSLLCFTHSAPVSDCSLLSPWFLTLQKLNSCPSPRQANIKSYYLHNWNRHLRQPNRLPTKLRVNEPRFSLISL